MGVADHAHARALSPPAGSQDHGTGTCRPAETGGAAVVRLDRHKRGDTASRRLYRGGGLSIVGANGAGGTGRFPKDSGSFRGAPPRRPQDPAGASLASARVTASTTVVLRARGPDLLAQLRARCCSAVAKTRICGLDRSAPVVAQPISPAAPRWLRRNLRCRPAACCACRPTAQHRAPGAVGRIPYFDANMVVSPSRLLAYHATRVWHLWRRQQTVPRIMGPPGLEPRLQLLQGHPAGRRRRQDFCADLRCARRRLRAGLKRRSGC